MAPKHPCLLFLAACSLLRPVQAGYGADRYLPVQRQQWCVLGADACSAAAGWYPPSWVWEQPPPCLGACPHVGPTHLPAHLPTHTTSPHPCPSPLPCSRLPHGSAGACRQYRPQVRRRCICPLLVLHLPLVAPHLLMCRCWKPAKRWGAWPDAAWTAAADCLRTPGCSWSVHHACSTVDKAVDAVNTLKVISGLNKMADLLKAS